MHISIEQGQLSLFTVLETVGKVAYIQIQIHKGYSSRYVRSEFDVPYDAVNKRLQSFDLIISLGDVVFDRDRFCQSGKGCSAIT